MVVLGGGLFLMSEVPLQCQSSGWAVQWEGEGCCQSTVCSRECLLCGEQPQKLFDWSRLGGNNLTGAAFFLPRGTGVPRLSVRKLHKLHFTRICLLLGPYAQGGPGVWSVSYERGTFAHVLTG